VAIASAGASASRIKIDAKEIATIPQNRRDHKI